MPIFSKRLKQVFIIKVTLVFVLMAGCTGSTEDVRLTLCKDLLPELKDSTRIEVLSEDIVVKGYEDLEVRLSYRDVESEGNITCFYPYNTHEENVMDHVNPAAAFATYPTKIMLDQQPVDHALMAKKINAVLVKQGKQALDAVSGVKTKP